ncbi:MAG: copper resistance protein CopC [Gemmatimonadaceae bacterium]
MTRVGILVLAVLASAHAPAHTARAPRAVAAAPLPHASLLASEPASGAVLMAAPSRIRLLFSEPIESSMSGVSITSAGRTTISVAVSTDPHDVHALLAPVSGLVPGAYSVRWHVLSADGHRVDGTFTFTISDATSPVAIGASASATTTDVRQPVPPTAGADARAAADSGFVAALGRRPMVAVLRAAAVTALLAVAGLALLIATLPISGPRPLHLAQFLAVAATTLLAAYLIVWSSTTVGPDYSVADAISLAATTTPGALEIARVALSLLALWALSLARRPGLAALFAGVAVLITGASGHSAVTHPGVAIPIKAAHLAAAAVWFGGLLWIVTAERHGARYVDGVRRISSLAFGSVLVVLATGIMQSVLLLPRWTAIADSTYGRVILAKAAGLLVLVFFGAFHRRIVPRLDTTMARRRLRGSVRFEIVVMIAVSVLGGLLAAIAPPR